MTLCLPFLMFQGQAQEAIDHYMETFADAELLELQHHPEGTEVFDPGAGDAADHDAEEGYPEDRADDAGPEAAAAERPARKNRLVATAQLKIGGQVLMIQDSLVVRPFGFTPAISVAVVVDTSAEFRETVDSLADGGEYLMEPGDYDFARNFAWVQDRFGLTWQVIHPAGAPEEEAAQAKAPEWG